MTGLQIFVVIAYYCLLGPFLKALRDIISFRWEWSIFTRLPRWLRVFLTDADPKPLSRSFDGWHLLDGMLMMIPLAIILWGYMPLWKVAIGVAIGWCAFYAALNLLYHRILMKRKYKRR